LQLAAASLPAGCTPSAVDASLAGPPAPAPVPVRVVPVEPGVVEQNLPVQGDLLARSVVALAPLDSGRLRTLRVQEGDTVQRGETLGTLDEELTAVRRGELSAQLEVARRRVRGAEAEREEAAREIERRQSLSLQGALSRTEVERLQDRLPVLEAQLALARSQVEEIAALQQRVRVELDRRRIESPMEGVVVARHLEPGAMVGPLTPVVTLIDPATLQWVVQVPERQAAALEVGMPARVQPQGEAGPERTGQIVFLSPLVDLESRTLEVRVEVARDPARTPLRHGGFATGHLELGRVESATTAPVEVLVEAGGQTAVWRVSDAGVERVEVEVEARNERRAALRGVAAGDRLVLRPVPSLRAGSAVRIVEDDDDRGSP
jgi:HlyD family secretion protein